MRYCPRRGDTCVPGLVVAEFANCLGPARLLLFFVGVRGVHRAGLLSQAAFKQHKQSYSTH